MLRAFFLLFLLRESTEVSMTTYIPLTHSSTTTTTTTPTTTSYSTNTMPRSTTEGMPFSVQLLATPNYPVAAGQRVNLHCSTSSMPTSVNWFWQQNENQIWEKVGNGTNLILTEPEQSGLYYCRATTSKSSFVSSNIHAVFIISVHATAGENLGIAAFVLSLLALMINIAIIFWLYRRRLDDTLTTLNTAAKAFPAPGKSPKGDFPKAESDADVYMNYTNTNQAYSDLDLANVNTDNVYSSLS